MRLLDWEERLAIASRLDELWAVAQRCGKGEAEALEAFPDLAKAVLDLNAPGATATDADRERYQALWTEIHSMVQWIVFARVGLP